MSIRMWCCQCHGKRRSSSSQQLVLSTMILQVHTKIIEKIQPASGAVRRSTATFLRRSRRPFAIRAKASTPRPGFPGTRYPPLPRCRRRKTGTTSTGRRRSTSRRWTGGEKQTTSASSSIRGEQTCWGSQQYHQS